MNEQPLPVDAAALARFHADLGGHVLLPGDAAYEARRGVWNAAVRSSPRLIARPADAREVASCVRFARAHGLPVVVRSGGHSPAGYGTGDGLVIDLSRLNAVQVDPLSRTARLQPGATWGEVAVALHRFGLALTAGDTATVGVGGLLQGGGIGWFVRKHGLAIDRVTAVEVVTSDGEVRRASATVDSELFWAVRGGGANVGIVTTFDVKVHEGGTVVGGAVFYDAADANVARSLLRRYADYARSAPDELTTQAILIAAPPAPFVPAELIGKPILGVMVCYSGNLAEGERIVEPLRRLAEPLMDSVGPTPYPDLFRLHEVGGRLGFRHHARSQFMADLGDEAIEALVTRILSVVQPGTLVQLRALGGAMSRVAASDTAFAHRDAAFLLLVDHMSPDDAGDAAERQARDATEFVFEGVRAFGSGAYGNFVGLADAGRARAVFPDVTFDRLAAVKTRVDPDNVLRRNVNVTLASANVALVSADD